MQFSKSALRVLSALLLAALGSAAGLSYQTWLPSTRADVFFPSGNATCNVYLTSISGSHAVAMQEYYDEGDECYRTWVTVAARRAYGRETGTLPIFPNFLSSL